jgi:predicted Zn finger-like uncharacterized protein
MSIAIQCPGCQATLRVKDELAGRKVKCPRCEASVPVPADEPAEEEITEAKPAPKREAQEDTKKCPECGKRIAIDARKCRYCKAVLEEEEEQEEEEEPEEEEARPKSKYKPCPSCGARGAKRVKWTAWGSFYGPRLFNHVRCLECGYGYNGKTGGSNLIPAIIFVAVPLIGILGIIAVIIWLLNSKGVINWF